MPNEFSSVAVRISCSTSLACLIRIDLAMMLTRCETKLEGPADCRLGVKSASLTAGLSLPAFFSERTFSSSIGMSQTCQ